MKPFIPPDATGMRDYFSVLLEHEPKLQAHLLEVCRQIPSLAALLRTLTPEEVEARRRASIALLKAAVFDGHWAALAAEQREQGALYANLDVPFADWCALVSAFQNVMVPHLVAAYGK